MSKKGYRRTITLDMDYTSVESGIANVSMAMKALDADFRKSSEEIKQNGVESQKLGLQHDVLGEKIKLQSMKVEALKTKYEEYKEANGEANVKTLAAKKAYDDATTALMKMESELSNVTDEMSNQETKLGSLVSKFDDFKSTASSVGIDVEAIGKTLMNLGTGLVGVGVAAAKMAMDFDSEMAKVESIADFSGTILGIDNLKTNVLNIGSDFNIVAGDMANGLYDLISSGTELSNTNQAMMNSALLARTGFTDMTTSVDVLTSFTNAYGLSIEEQTNLVDKLIMTQNNGKVTIDELGGSFGKIAGLAKESGVGIDELLAALSTITSTGLPATSTITALKGVLSAVSDPTSKAAEAAKEMGISFNSAALKSKGFAGFLEDVQKKAGGNTEALAKMFGSVDAFNSMLILTGSGFEKYKTDLEDVTNSTDTATVAFEKLQTPGEKLSAAMNNLKNNMIDTGGSFQPVIEFVAKLIDGFATLSPGLITVGAGVGALVLLLGGLVKTVITLNELMKVYETIKSLIATKQAAQTLLTKANTVAMGANATAQGVASATGGTLAATNTILGLSFSTIALAIGAILVIIGLVVAAYLLLSKTSKETAKDIKNDSTDITKTMSTLKSSAQNSANKSSGFVAYAKGTSFHGGGRAIVGEEGPELVDLPRGSKVHTAKQTRGILENTNGDVHNYYVTVDFSKVQSMKDMENFFNNFKRVSNSMP